MRNFTRRLVLVLLALELVGCAASASSQVPTGAEARAFLAQIVALAQRDDFEGLCALSDGNCQKLLDTWGRAVPANAPTVTAVRDVAASNAAGVVGTAGVVLALCGHDSAGAAYTSEMFVFRDGSSLRAINPVYWGNTKIAVSDTTLASPAPSPSC
jgi:hypothetical protein